MIEGMASGEDDPFTVASLLRLTSGRMGSGPMSLEPGPVASSVG